MRLPSAPTDCGRANLPWDYGIVTRALVTRPAAPADLAPLAALCAALWPETPSDEHAREIAPLLDARTPHALPVVWLLAVVEDHVAGFLQAGLRSHADGCDPSHPVGYVEGWYVEEPFRGQGIGRALLTAAETWARSHGCREMASDALIANLPSQRVHEALGFEVVDRCVHYRKPL
jgi:aminoglycoside 6'-N-acetyltransferase I